jgi:hypothetical protein
VTLAVAYVAAEYVAVAYVIVASRRGVGSVVASRHSLGGDAAEIRSGPSRAIARWRSQAGPPSAFRERDLASVWFPLRANPS